MRLMIVACADFYCRNNSGGGFVKVTDAGVPLEHNLSAVPIPRIALGAYFAPHFTRRMRFSRRTRVASLADKGPLVFPS